MSEQTLRAARLRNIETLLHQHPGGLTVREIANRVGTSTRTIQRDMSVLESDLHVPIMTQGRRYRIDPESAQLAPVRLTLNEARALVLATRLFARHSDDHDPDAASAIEKLAGTLTSPLAGQIAETAKFIRSRPENQQQIDVLRQLTISWAHSTTVAIRYRSSGATRDRVMPIDPYLLEPAPNGAGIYLIGYSHHHKEVRTFKVDRIISAASSGERFEPTAVDEVRARLQEGWGVVFGGDDRFDICIEFSPAVAHRVRETHWHPSQRLTDLPDGGVRMELQLPSLLEFVPWVRGWGHEVKVIGPVELRDEIATSLAKAAALYN